MNENHVRMEGHTFLHSHQITKHRFGHIRTLQLCNNSQIYLFIMENLQI